MTGVAALPGRRRPERRRADSDPRSRRRAQGQPVRSAAPRRTAQRGGALRQADPADPEPPSPRRSPNSVASAGRRRPARRHRHPGVGRRRRAGARSAGGRHRLAHLRAGPAGDHGRPRRGAGDQRARPTPTTPARCWPTCRPYGSGSVSCPAQTPDLPRRRGQQHGPLLSVGRGAGRAARTDRCTRGVSSPTRMWSPAPSDWPRTSGGSVLITDSAAEAARGSDVLATDTWISMGQEDDGRDRETIFAPYRLTHGTTPGRGLGCGGVALPARLPRQGDRRRGAGRTAVDGVGRGGEPAARPEGDLDLPPRQARSRAVEGPSTGLGNAS